MMRRTTEVKGREEKKDKNIIFMSTGVFFFLVGGGKKRINKYKLQKKRSCSLEEVKSRGRAAATGHALSMRGNVNTTVVNENKRRTNCNKILKPGKWFRTAVETMKRWRFEISSVSEGTKPEDMSRPDEQKTNNKTQQHLKDGSGSQGSTQRTVIETKHCDSCLHFLRNPGRTFSITRTSLSGSGHLGFRNEEREKGKRVEGGGGKTDKT